MGGCIHTGSGAKIGKYYEDDYYNIRGSDEIVIADASDGTFDFEINHYYTSYYYLNGTDVENKMAADLNITINGEEIGSFSHYDDTVNVGVYCVECVCTAYLISA